jgi:hypothetical protein
MQNVCRVASVAVWCHLQRIMDIGVAKSIGPGRATKMDTPPSRCIHSSTNGRFFCAKKLIDERVQGGHGSFDIKVGCFLDLKCFHFSFFNVIFCRFCLLWVMRQAGECYWGLGPGCAGGEQWMGGTAVGPRVG